MVTVRRSADRGHANHGWLDSHHTFSFADYFDPEHVQFRALRVINEDRVSGGQGFGRHPHRDMEIISYVVSGLLEHQDSMGNRAVMKAGDVQRISAGTGVVHSEYNGSPVDPVHFLQIWIMPDRNGVKPDYAERSFGDIAPGGLNLIASGSAKEGALHINQDADVYVAKIDAGGAIEHAFAGGRAGWVQLIEGELSVNGTQLQAGDGAAVTDEQQVQLKAQQPAHFLLFDLN
jgi:redox-sensitive bicupin YhaK (pirin superfamily)